MKIAVCVKYVPVVSQLRFDYANKTIVREGVPSEINPFDRLGVVRAVALKSSPADQVLAISMGPPQAREGLVQCLALGADRAVLLTDRALAGSDTLATARALALVLERERPDLIMCGRNSTDAETGQVGPEVAELLGLPHISQVRRLTYQAEPCHIVAERVTDEGYQVIACPLPALVCVTEGVAPERYPLPQEMAEAQAKAIEEVACCQLSSDPSLFGLEGSPTRVQHIRLVTPNRLGVIISEQDAVDAAETVAARLRERLDGLAAETSPSAQVGSVRHRGDRRRSIWVVAETVRDGLRRVTLELLGKARALSAVTRSEVAAVLVGPTQDSLVQELGAYGADRVLVLDNTSRGPVWGRAVSYALADIVRAAQPYAVLFASTVDGRDLASRIAARLQLGLTGDAIDLEIDDQGHLVQLKPALGGHVIAPILSKTLPNLTTLRPGMLTPIAPERGANVAIERIAAPTLAEADVTTLEVHREEEADAVALTQAQVVMGVGMGIGGPENLPRVQALARVMGAALATTRNVVHAGWLPHHIQVGISGRTIAPRVYLAVGIRGAFNHTVGIQKAGVIIAVNQNPRAAIFKAADYGIIGDWRTYLPPLAEALQPVLAAVNASSHSASYPHNTPETQA
jgi:electron transfer flavoprotein alpha subunit